MSYSLAGILETDVDSLSFKEFALAFFNSCGYPTLDSEFVPALDVEKYTAEVEHLEKMNYAEKREYGKNRKSDALKIAQFAMTQTKDRLETQTTRLRCIDKFIKKTTFLHGLVEQNDQTAGGILKNMLSYLEEEAFALETTIKNTNKMIEQYKDSVHRIKSKGAFEWWADALDLAKNDLKRSLFRNHSHAPAVNAYNNFLKALEKGLDSNGN
jgi:hypothetical protein